MLFNINIKVLKIILLSYRLYGEKEYNMDTILVIFKDGREVIYTKNILLLLLSDKDVLQIVDMQTGEMLY